MKRAASPAARLRPSPLLLALTAAVLLAAGGALAQSAPSTAPSGTAGAGSSTSTPAAPSTPAAGTSAAPTPTPNASSAGGSSDVQISDRAYAIASKLRCPVCTAESVADSNAEIAGEMRHLIQQQLDAGKNEAQIVSYFRQRYGDWILLDPPKTGVHLVVWLLPLLALLGGVTALVLLFRRWRAAAESVPDAPAEDLQRVREALHPHKDDA